jgi:hypothetical protein
LEYGLLIDDRLKLFRSELTISSPNILVRRHILSGECFILDATQHFELKEQISGKFAVHPNQIAVVGSGKLGFSIAPAKRYRPFDHNTSDIDVAVVAPDLFDKIWLEAFDYWLANRDYWNRWKEFSKYLFRGWIWQRALPSDGNFPARTEWDEFFLSLTGSGTYGRYPINGIIYKSWHFLERYQIDTVEECQQEALRGTDENVCDQ